MQKLPQNWFHKITLGDKNNEIEHNDDNFDQIMTIINMITMISDNYIKFISREYITIFGMPIIWRYNIFLGKYDDYDIWAQNSPKIIL